MRVGFFQSNPKFGDIQGNVNHVTEILSGVDADLIVLPELFNTGYQFVSKKEIEELSENIPDGFTTRQLLKLTKDKGFYLVAGLAEREGDHFYNSAILLGPKGLCTVYRKIHLFYEETLWFTKGNKGLDVVTLLDTRIGLMVCFDWMFPEVTRTLAIKGADIICHPSNLILPHCPNAMVTRALENRIFTITANRIGIEQRNGKEKLIFIGQSEIVHPTGQILHRASQDTEALYLTEINPLEARDKRINRYNHLLNDRNPKFYGI